MTSGADPAGGGPKGVLYILIQVVSVFAFLTPVVGPPLFAWYLSWGKEVVERVQLGVVMGVDANREPAPVGAPSPRWVIETQKGFYPLYEPIVIEKGARVVLATTRSGRQLICDEAGQMCARTSDAGRQITRRVP